MAGAKRKWNGANNSGIDESPPSPPKKRTPSRRKVNDKVKISPIPTIAENDSVEGVFATPSRNTNSAHLSKTRSAGKDKVIIDVSNRIDSVKASPLQSMAENGVIDSHLATPFKNTGSSRLIMTPSAGRNMPVLDISPLSSEHDQVSSDTKPAGTLTNPSESLQTSMQNFGNTDKQIHDRMDIDNPSLSINVTSAVSCNELLLLLDKAIGPSLSLSCQQYSSATVLLLSWQEDDLKSKIDLDELGKAFKCKFGFAISSLELATSKPRPMLNHAIIECLKARDAPDNLLILCYAGHDATDRDSQTVLRASNTSLGQINLLDIHQMIASNEPESSILYLMDCRCTDFSSAEQDHKVVKGEILCASSWTGISSHKQNNAFIQALTAQLNSLSANPSISVAELHARLEIDAGFGSAFPKVSHHAIFGRRPIGSTILNSVTARPTTSVGNSMTGIQDSMLAPADILRGRGDLSAGMLLPLVQVSIEVAETAVESFRQWNTWRESVKRGDEPSVLSLSTLNMRDLFIMEGVHAATKPGGCIWTLNIPKLVYDNGLAQVQSIKFLRTLRSPNLLPTTGSQRLPKPYSPLDNLETEDPLLNDWSTVTHANWWAVEDRQIISDRYHEEPLRTIIKFVEDKTSFAWVLERHGKFAEAERLCQDAVTKFATDRIWDNSNHAYVLNALKNLAMVQSRQKSRDKLTEAMATFQDLRLRCLAIYGEDVQWVTHIDYHIAILTGQLGNIEGARDLFNALISVMKNGPALYFAPRKFSCMYQFAKMNQQLKEYALAEKQYIDLITCFSEAHGQQHTIIIAASTRLAEVLRSQGKDLAAEIVSSSVSRLLSKDLIGNPQPIPPAWDADAETIN